jgi:hypothetical protein
MEESKKNRIQERLDMFNTIKSMDELPRKSLERLEKAKAKRVKDKETDRTDIKTDL